MQSRRIVRAGGHGAPGHRGCGRAGRRRAGRTGRPGHERQPAQSVLAEQAERAGGRDRPAASERRSPRAPTTTSTWRPATPARTTRARSPPASASRASRSRPTAARPGRSRPTRGLSARGCLGAVGDDDPAVRAASRGRSARCPTTSSNDLVSDGDPARRLRAALPRRRALLVRNGSRLYYANLDLGDPGHARRSRARRRSPSRTRTTSTGATAGDNDALERPGDRQPPERRAVLRQGADLGRQRAVEPVLRQRLRLLRRLPRQRQRQPAAGRPRLARRRRDAGRSSRSRRRRTTSTAATASGAAGCTVRTDSRGVVYVFDFQFGFSATTAAAGPDPDDQVVRRRRALGRGR